MSDEMNRQDMDNMQNDNGGSEEPIVIHTGEHSAGTGAAESGSGYFDYTKRSDIPVSSTVEPEKKKKRDKKARKPAGVLKKTAACIGFGLLFGAVAGVGFHAVDKGMDRLFPEEQTAVIKEVPATNTVSNDNTVTTTTTTTQYVTYVQNEITEMVDNVMPAMVSIVNNYTTTSYGFWGQGYTQNAVASGSGIIVGQTDTALLIATNNHVVEGSNKLEVTFIDGNTAEAIIKGTDPDMDLAVIAVSLDSLSSETKAAISVAKLGDSDSLKLGETVVAIGNALGYGQSVTTGIVSALNREIETEDGSTNTFIQTDAAINPGNSGGALLNINGEVIGINSSKIGGSTIEGMGYAIPISSASPILSDLMSREVREKVEDSEIGYIGVSMQAINEDVYNSLGLPKGIYVTDVAEGSPAEEAGIKKRDIIVKFDGQKVSSPTDLKEQLSYYKAGEEVPVTIQRSVDGEYKEYEITLKLGTRPDSLR